MTAAMFDTAESVDELVESGVERAQAKVFVSVIRRAQETALAAQAKEQQEVSSRAVSELDSKTEKALIKLDGKVDLLRKDMEAMKKDLIIWLGGLVIGGFVVIGGMLIKLLP